MWSSPIRQKKVKVEKVEEKWEKPKLRLSKAEAKKFLTPKEDLSMAQVEWCQNWLSQFVRERSLPPQIVGADGYGVLHRFLSPQDVSEALGKIRSEFEKTLPLKKADDFDFLLASAPPETYLAHLPPPHPLPHNNH